MKKNYLSLIILCCLLFAFNSADAQKKIERIHTYYQADAYYLTIKKIKELKPRTQSRKDVQYILADCYWKIGEKDRSLQLYKNVSKIGRIPGPFQAKYAKAIEAEPKTLLVNSLIVNQLTVSAAPPTKRKIADFSFTKEEEELITMISCIKWP